MTSATAVRAPRRLAVAAMVLVTACGVGEDGAPLPDASIVSLTDGSTSNLAAIDGPAVVNLWATWCVPCRREIPEFERVHQARGDEIAFVGINVGEAADDAAAFVAEVGATYPQYLDPEGYAATGLEATTMPMTVVTDADGTIVTRHPGEMSRDELEAAIDDAVG